MSRRSARRGWVSGVALAVCTTLGLTAAPALAQREVVKDARRDVQEVVIPEDLGPLSYLPAPSVTGADIVRTTIDHRRYRLVATAQMRDIVRREKPGVVLLVTTANDRFEIAFIPGGGLAGEDSYDFTAQSGSPRKCPELAGRLSVRTDLVRLSVPRRCLGSPRWVRVRVATVSSSDKDTRLFIDDGRREGMRRNLVLTEGPRLRRGR